MEEAIGLFDVPRDRVYTDVERCLEETRPDVVVLCPASARHGEWTERVARAGVHIVMEKPFAASLAEADRMAAAVAETGKRLMINWPLAWMPSHRTAKRLIDEGRIGEVWMMHPPAVCTLGILKQGMHAEMVHRADHPGTGHGAGETQQQSEGHDQQGHQSRCASIGGEVHDVR